MAEHRYVEPDNGFWWMRADDPRRQRRRVHEFHNGDRTHELTPAEHRIAHATYVRWPQMSLDEHERAKADPDGWIAHASATSREEVAALWKKLDVHWLHAGHGEVVSDVIPTRLVTHHYSGRHEAHPVTSIRNVTRGAPEAAAGSRRTLSYGGKR